MRSRTLLAATCALLLCLGARPVAAAEGDLAAAEAPVSHLYEALLACMKDAAQLGFDGRVKRLTPIVTRTYDLPFMAEKALGRYWKDLDESQRKRWLEAFTEMTISTYANRFDSYSGEKLEVLGADPSARDTVMVRTRISPADEAPVEVNYRMRRGPDGWLAIDAYLNGTVSELALRRSEYTSAFARDGFEKLVTSLSEKAKVAQP